MLTMVKLFSGRCVRSPVSRLCLKRRNYLWLSFSFFWEGGKGGGGVRVDFWAEGFSNNSSKFKIFIYLSLLF